MDRFIGAFTVTANNFIADLKSNMDRFIALDFPAKAII